MSKTELRPVAFVFPLSDVGDWLQKPVPPKYAGCPGYWCRSAHEDCFAELGAIDEPEMEDGEADDLLAWVNEYVDACNLRQAIYTDEEHAEIDEPDDDSFGFHPGVTLAEGIEALGAGGFRVVVAPFPQALRTTAAGTGGARYAEQLDAVVERLALHLDFASTPAALALLKESSVLSPQLQLVSYLLDGFLGTEDDDDLTQRLLGRLGDWSGAERDKLRIVLAQMTREKGARGQSLSPNIPKLRAALGRPESPEVEQALG
jgi:hypothetical protein